MNQVLLYKTFKTGPMFFFVRKRRVRHDEVDLAHRDSLLYNQSKFKKAIALYPEFECINSSPSNMRRSELIDRYEDLGWVCLNVHKK